MLQTVKRPLNWATDVQQSCVMHLLYMSDSLALNGAVPSFRPGSSAPPDCLWYLVKLEARQLSEVALHLTHPSNALLRAKCSAAQPWWWVTAPHCSVLLCKIGCQQACVPANTPMEICSSYRCAVTQHQCTAALFRSECNPHCSLLMCKSDSQQTVCHCSYTYEDMLLHTGASTPRYCSIV